MPFGLFLSGSSQRRLYLSREFAQSDIAGKAGEGRQLGGNDGPYIAHCLFRYQRIVGRSSSFSFTDFLMTTLPVVAWKTEIADGAASNLAGQSVNRLFLVVIQGRFKLQGYRHVEVPMNEILSFKNHFIPT